MIGRQAGGRVALATVVILAVASHGCGSGDDGTPPASESGGESGSPSTGTAPADPAPSRPTVGTTPSTWDEWLFTAHILISYADAPEAVGGVTRSREDARRQAQALRVLALKPGESFADLAHRFSEDSHTRDLGGKMPPFRPDMGLAAYAEAAAALTPGEISEPVDTPLGYVIIQRLAPALATVRYVFVAFTGSNLAREGLVRTREEARELAARVHAMLVGGADFLTVAQEYSDHGAPTYTRDFAQGVVTGPLDRAIFALEVGELSGVVESEYGYHVLKRVK